ncbi:MAG: (2Fe-2S)-binding protein [Pirellulales bacterium]
MELDDEICLCFHVSKRKIVNFLRVERPRRAGELSECFGAGTGCGWCRRYLERLFQESIGGSPGSQQDVTPDQWARQRAEYRAALDLEDSSDSRP